ncbi:Fc.00g089530.m01.CDS01 [Cosmosporella sp. VM-42]
MAAMRGPRLQVGSAAWIAEERSSALQIADSEVEEFTYSARNELDWLNEHMAGIFNENETNIAEAFKTPGKLRGKTPRTARKLLPIEARVPLSDVFGSTPIASASRFAQPTNRLQSPLIQRGSPSPVKVASPRVQVYSGKPHQSQTATQDSGYHGSQDIDSMDVEYADVDEHNTPNIHFNHAPFHTTTTVPVRQSPSRTVALDSPDKTFRTAREEQTTRVLADLNSAVEGSARAEPENGEEEERDVIVSPSPQRTGAAVPALSPSKGQLDSETNNNVEQTETQQIETPFEDNRSPSDGSSPIRPVVRKSSLNFAPLPAREPMAAGKSIGARVSRTSHLDHNRTSYYSRPTGGKSLGNHAKRDVSEDENHDEMDVDEQESHELENLAVHHNKTYTQRLQDQINMLGKSQPNGGRPSKSIPNVAVAQQTAPVAPQPAQEPKSPSPRKLETATTPGAFPEDDDDDWIEPPSVGPAAPMAANQRPSLPKSHTADIMEGIHSKDSVGGSDFAQVESYKGSQSPSHQGSSVHERPSFFGHGKSASVSALPATLNGTREGSPLKQTVSVSNPYLAMATVPEKGYSPTPSKSPSRSFRDSPLKQVKNKLSSILKSSKGLLASSAALSAEGKSSILSPSTTRLGMFAGPSTESVVSKSSLQPRSDVEDSRMDREGSPSRPIARRTRASVEREKEEKRREKEAQRFADQMDKLDKAREKEREKARVFSKEQEKIAALEKQVASKKETEKPAPKETPKPTRSSPRKAKTQEEPATKPVDQDVEMSDAPSAMPPPSVPRSAGPSQGIRNKEIKRPMRPGKEAQLKAKQAPTVIRVNTGSQQQHSQYNPSSSTMSSNYSDHGSSTSSQSQLGSKASKAPLGTKPSLQSLKGSASTGRPKALELAARKKEQDERDAQRRRDAKAEIERKRAAVQEEQRKQEQQRRQEAERLRQKEREQAEAKKTAQRQAAIERAKQTRAPPPAARSQPNGPPDYSLSQGQRGDGPPTRPQSRMNSGIQRSQEDSARPVNAVLSNASKAMSKRPLGQDGNEDGQARRPPSRGGPAYQAKDAKRRRTSDDFVDELEMDNPPNIKGPPVRPSGGFKKDLQAKSMFSNGYSNVPQSATRDLFKATVTAQHTTQTKAAHPLDMAQISKGAIPFAPNPNPAGPSYKTPARPGPVNNAKSVAKSAQRSSPRFQNGESIELPEIQTDDEDEDDEEEHGGAIAPWADSPDLRRALMRQETMDPSQIFGPPAPLNMEEVFSKSKDKWHKFRARTSSANWSGTDRLTEDDIRKDLAARDKMRREGGWSYEMSKDMV